jgi:hypothetical protein
MATIYRAFLLIGSTLIVYLEQRSVIGMYSEHRAADDGPDISEKHSHTGPDLQPSPPLSYWVAR